MAYPTLKSTLKGLKLDWATAEKQTIARERNKYTFFMRLVFVF
jgi:hypothetical protein